MKSLQLAKPHIVVMIGVPGSGKTTFGEQFAETFQAPYISARTMSNSGLSEYASLELANTVLNQLYRTKHTIVYEGLSGSRAERSEVAQAARKAGYQPLFVWAQTDPSVAKARKTRGKKAPMDADTFDTLLRKFTPPNATEPYVVISGMRTYASQVKSVLKYLTDGKEQRDSSVQAPERQATARSQPGRRSISIN